MTSLHDVVETEIYKAQLAFMRTLPNSMLAGGIALYLPQRLNVRVALALICSF